MLTAHKIKIIQSLDKKKFRQKYNLFLVEGNKNIQELPNSGYKILEIFSTEPSKIDFDKRQITEISKSELKKISFLQHPKDAVALCELRETKEIETKINLILDGIQDPGNLGTIIRLADWFGIEQIVCSEDTVDFYNPKVVQASMGSFSRVNVIYKNLAEFLKISKNQSFGTDMQGENLYNFDFPEKFNLVLGNEGNGMREEVEELVSKNITIPRFGKKQATESLNVSMSAGIILGEVFSRKK